jgi:hypothetical protein
MHDLFNQTDVNHMLERIERLGPESQRQWGKMNVAQMLAHCHVSLETAMGDNVIRRPLIGRLIGSFFKSRALNEKPFTRNSPTDGSYKFTDNRDFAEEKSKMISAVKKFSEGGPAGCTKYPHPFFGHFTPEEWAVFQWKHLDHHLRQFGV